MSIRERGMSGMMYAMTLGFDEAGRRSHKTPPVTPFSLNGCYGLPAPAGGARPPAKMEIVMPPVSVRIGRDDIRLAAEMPGVLVENIDIRVLPNRIEILGEPIDKDRPSDDYEAFEQAIPGSRRERLFTGAVPPKGAIARFQNGVLELRLPKKMVLSGRRMSRIPVM
jgi:HSP20 family molecular chaperone IbpA